MKSVSRRPSGADVRPFVLELRHAAKSTLVASGHVAICSQAPGDPKVDFPTAAALLPPRGFGKGFRYPSNVGFWPKADVRTALPHVC